MSIYLKNIWDEMFLPHLCLKEILNDIGYNNDTVY
jgi:hypothetical protein